MKELGTDGVIAHLADTQVIESIMNLEVPAVIACVKEPVANAHVLETNGEAISQMAVDYFVDRGFHRLAYCGLDEMYWSRQRGETFRRKATEAGCEVRVYEQPARKRLRTDEMEQPILADWLRSLPKPTALLACNDDRSKQILAACKIAELEVPDEVAILGDHQPAHRGDREAAAMHGGEEHRQVLPSADRSDACTIPQEVQREVADATRVEA